MVLRCIRGDESETWQKHTRHAGHFVFHDLTHYAVETTLKYRRGFFGLIADGGDIEDTSGKEARRALPAETVDVERIVGLFDSERGSKALWTAEELNEFAPRALGVQEIQAIRAVRSALFQKWFATGNGETMELRIQTGSSGDLGSP